MDCRFEPGSDGEELCEAGMAVAALVEAEDDLFEIDLKMGSSQPVIDGEYRSFKAGEGTMDPRQDDLDGQGTDDVGLMIDALAPGLGDKLSVLAVATLPKLAARKAWSLVAERFLI